MSPPPPPAGSASRKEGGPPKGGLGRGHVVRRAVALLLVVLLPDDAGEAEVDQLHVGQQRRGVVELVEVLRQGGGTPPGDADQWSRGGRMT